MRCRLLLEVASTAQVDANAACAAADEYARSPAFKQFVTSALLQYTDLPASIETVSFVGLIEGQRAILIKAIYQNQGNQTMPMKLPDNTTINFLPNDTIRLLISRKYADCGITALTEECGLSSLAHDRSIQERNGFGLDLVLCAIDPALPSSVV
jgi:L-histidine Nalpha-methyltransferase